LVAVRAGDGLDAGQAGEERGSVGGLTREDVLDGEYGV
jgi:hypothetical protein